VSPINISSERVDGLEVVHMSNGLLALALMPTLGGKLSSLRDLRSGREWLWRHPRMAYRSVAYGGSYIHDGDTGGWDECFPSVAPCSYPSAPYAGAPIQDHGELWSQAARLQVRHLGDSMALETTWRGIALPYTFSRAISISATEPTLRFSYRVANHSDARLPFIWSAHPLLAIEPGMELRTPPEARFNCNGTFPPNLTEAMSGLAFPLTLNTESGPLPFDPMPGPESAVAMKLWSDPLADGWATLTARDGALHMRWDVRDLPQLALWVNLGAWAGDSGAPYYNLGLEPCIGAQDSLATAVTERDLYATLPPRGARSWQLEVELRA
jgi:galactose mutarotase-like enzyme